jgi:hypothetical protein
LTWADELREVAKQQRRKNEEREREEKAAKLGKQRKEAETFYRKYLRPGLEDKIKNAAARGATSISVVQSTADSRIDNIAYNMVDKWAAKHGLHTHTETSHNVDEGWRTYFEICWSDHKSDPIRW